MLSFVFFALAIFFGASLALLTLQSLLLRFAGAATSSMILGGRIGGLGMILPGYWLAIFVGAPLSSGVAIGIAGESAMRPGALLGVFATLFVGVSLGGVLGAFLALACHRVAKHSSRTDDVKNGKTT